jgi:hypothetical protein
MAVSDTDLAGWSIRWYDANSPGEPVTYRAFGAGLSLRDARVARVYAGLPTGQADPGTDTYFGGAAGSPPTTGAIFQLVDPAGRVTHEFAVLPPTSYSAVSGIVAIPNDDGTRAFIMPTSGSLTPGHWRLGFRFDGDGGFGLPVLSVGGSTGTEQAAISFTVE